MKGAIGVFDSGIGGLTVLKEIARLLPDEDTIYLGDTARVPYGTKSPETVAHYSIENTSFLIEKGLKIPLELKKRLAVFLHSLCFF